MSGLSHMFEREGLSTIMIGLVPQHVRRMRPPRALLVPFDLGRPLGAPNRPDLQREVLDAAIRMLDDASSAPHVAQFETALELDETDADEVEGWSCPVTFPTPPPDTDPITQVREEIRLLRPWYDRGQGDRGHTAVGASGLDVDEIAPWLARLADGDVDDPQDPPEEGALGLRFKLAVEDLKAFYLEAATAQPGATSAREAFDWFWSSTAAADFLRRLRDALGTHDDPYVQLYALGTLVPNLRPT